MSSESFRVEPGETGERLDRLAGRRLEISRSSARRLIEDGLVLVTGKQESPSYKVREGDAISAEVPEPGVSPEDIPVPVVFEDEHLIVVDKPAGLVVHPGAGHTTGTLVHGLLAQGVAGGDEEKRPGIVHRLDRDTSGLMVVARSEESHRRLQALVRRRELEREYAALVRGRPHSRRGRIEAPIGRDRSEPTRQSLDTETPREAVTHFEVQELLAAHALLRVRLETGRTHQIRVHLAAVDLPVSGDPAYGVAGDLGLARQFLHAQRLAFGHPFTGAALDVRSPLPPELAAALDRARG